MSDTLRTVHDLKAEVAELPESARNSAAAELCTRFIDEFGQLIADQADTRSEVFSEEDEGVSVITHAAPTKRQVTFDFRPDGRTIEVTSIDENMRRTTRTCRIDHASTLREAIAWLNPA